jgi:hypothetical protein
MGLVNKRAIDIEMDRMAETEISLFELRKASRVGRVVLRAALNPGEVTPCLRVLSRVTWLVKKLGR